MPGEVGASVEPTNQSSHGNVFATNRAIGRVFLEVAAYDGRTHQVRLHESGPLRVRFPNVRSRELEAVLVNTAGGIAGGDQLDLEIRVGTGAELAITAAAAEKVYRSCGPPACTRIKLTGADRAALAWIPQETILFDRARFERSIEVELGSNSRLLLCEALVLGRRAMGEAVRRADFLDRWRVRRCGRLLFADTTRLCGAVAEQLREPASAGGASAIASVLCVPGDERTTERLRSERFLGEVGVSTWNGLTLVRMVAETGEELRRDLLAVFTVFRAGALPRLWTT
jgi:urease accessory protein